jgi:hypothetical protein
MSHEIGIDEKNGVIAWIEAEAEQPWEESGEKFHENNKAAKKKTGDQPRTEDLVAHQFPNPHPLPTKMGRSGAPENEADEISHPSKIAKGGEAYVEQSNDAVDAEQMLQRVWEESYEEGRQRRPYRGRTAGMLRRYMQYSIETGRLPSLLGREFFRAKVTSYQVVTFEERVIFVHDMEKCLDRLDEFSRQLIARHILQEHDQAATARLLQCTERTVRRLTPLVLDQLAEILLERGLLERLDSIEKKSCQGGLEGEISVSDCEDSENKRDYAFDAS